MLEDSAIKWSLPLQLFSDLDEQWTLGDIVRDNVEDALETEFLSPTELMADVLFAYSIELAPAETVKYAIYETLQKLLKDMYVEGYNHWMDCGGPQATRQIFYHSENWAPTKNLCASI